MAPTTAPRPGYAGGSDTGTGGSWALVLGCGLGAMSAGGLMLVGVGQAPAIVWGLTVSLLTMIVHFAYITHRELNPERLSPLPLVVARRKSEQHRRLPARPLGALFGGLMLLGSIATALF